ncbi:UDP-glucose/GDP-mannose dehydrogenase family protein [Idiomarina seosinensis]|uniref:UDP-glucose dehydrogenase family protein n=1 Tax=Idiomarina seosinensis TaxID=281739 RepID=UPI00384EAAB5
MKVSVFGCGYVGLVQAAVMAECGHKVTCVDIDQQRVDNLKKGIVDIYEPGLSAVITTQQDKGHLTFSAEGASAIADQDAIFIAVGTPESENGQADMRAVYAVATEIGQKMTQPSVVVIKSTVPLKTADKLKAIIQEQLDKRGEALNFDVVSNPEFLKEGSALTDCRKPDRIIIGTEQQNSREVMLELYAPFNRNHDKIIFMDNVSAELTKYAANCMLATKISFMNEMANIADLCGADIDDVRRGIGSDPRIGYHFIYPGCGYGGSCFPKDTIALLSCAEELGYQAEMLTSVRSVNARQKEKLGKAVIEQFGDSLQGQTFALWGIAFKPNTDDIREAPSLEVLKLLLNAGADVNVFDPQALDNLRKEKLDADTTGTIHYCDCPYQATENATALILCTEWKEFWAPEWDTLKHNLKTPMIFDGRNLFDPQDMAELGFVYRGIGRRN